MMIDLNGSSFQKEQDLRKSILFFEPQFSYQQSIHRDGVKGRLQV